MPAETSTTSPEAAPAAEVRETRPQRQEFTSPERGGYVIAPGLTMAGLYRVIYDRLDYCVGEMSEGGNSSIRAKLTELTDGDALCQRACVEIEKLLGIYPNIMGNPDPDDPPKWSRNRALARATQQGPAMSDDAKPEVLLLGNAVIQVLNGGRGTTPPCPEALHQVGDVVKVRRLKHLKHLPERAAVVIVVPPNFSPECALADAKGEPRPLMVTIPYKTVSYICAFEDNPKPHLFKERDLIATGERAEVGFEEPRT